MILSARPHETPVTPNRQSQRGEHPAPKQPMPVREQEGKKQKGPKAN